MNDPSIVRRYRPPSLFFRLFDFINNRMIMRIITKHNTKCYPLYQKVLLKIDKVCIEIKAKQCCKTINIYLLAYLHILTNVIIPSPILSHTNKSVLAQLCFAFSKRSFIYIDFLNPSDFSSKEVCVGIDDKQHYYLFLQM